MIDPTGYERRKEPEKVRAALIEAAAQLIADHGLSRLTIDAVARAAGVTKGGLFHHFASKDDLIQGLLDVVVATAEASIANLMAADPEPHGRFTRAYLAGVFDPPPVAELTSSRTLCMAMLADPKLQEFWFHWVARQVTLHAATDANPACALVRYAADGIWLNSLRSDGAPPPIAPEVRDMLTALTRPTS